MVRELRASQSRCMGIFEERLLIRKVTKLVRCYIGHSKGTVEAEVAQLASQGEAIADLNHVVLDGDVIDMETLQVHCDTLPFLGGAKLVVVRDLLSRCLKEKPLRDGLLAYLPGLPDHCTLVLADHALPRGRETTALTKALRNLPGGTVDVADQRRGRPQVSLDRRKRAPVWLCH